MNLIVISNIYKWPKFSSWSNIKSIAVFLVQCFEHCSLGELKMPNNISLPIQVVFRNMPPSDAVEQKVREQALKLHRYYDRILSCKIAIEISHKHQHKGFLYHVRIDLTIPNAQLVVSRDPMENHAHEDAYVAIRDAFISMRRKLQNFVRKQHHMVKHHEKPLHGRIIEIAPPADYGYIETDDGGEIRFSSNSVIDYDFDKLEVGDEVRFVEAENDEEPSASTVHVTKKHQSVGES